MLLLAPLDKAILPVTSSFSAGVSVPIPSAPMNVEVAVVVESSEPTVS